MRRNITYRSLLKDSINDWFLPSKDALAAMHTNLYAEGIGNFQLADYWSSSEYSNTKAWKHDFFTNTQSAYTKAGVALIRPCRSFTAGIGDYIAGDTGPAGGLIFNVDSTVYHEALAYDLSSSYTWSNLTGIEIGVTAQGTAVGTGQGNTLAIIGQVGGESDWFLPSRDELDAIRNNLFIEGLGGFDNVSYWSSTEYNAIYAWLHNFMLPTQGVYSKNKTARVRACRSFIATAGAYVVKDIGPAGGLIFYVDGGTTYYEVALSNQGVAKAWSNIDDAEIGVTAQGKAIGTGQANTTAIIDQVDHTNSAAKVCDDYDNTCAHTSSAAKECNDLII